MRIQHLQVSVGTPEKNELAHFYARLLGSEVVWKNPPVPGESEGSGWTHLDVSTESGEFRINFEHDDTWQPPVWPSEAGKQNITQHLDVFVDDLDEAVAFAQECGATVDPHQFEEIIRVMRDPHGHPFCLIKDEDQ